MKPLSIRYHLSLFFLLLIAAGIVSADEPDPVCSNMSGRTMLYEIGLARGHGDTTRAMRLLTCYLAQYPDDTLALVALGDVSVQAGNPDAALTAYNQALALAPNNANAFDGRGVVAMNYNWNELAFKDFDSAIQADPTLARAYNHRGLMWQEAGDLENAANDFWKAIDLGYQPVLEARWNLALVYEASGDDIGLEATLFDLLQTAPDYLPAYDKLIAVLQRLNKTSEAQQVLGQLYERQTGKLDPTAVAAVNQEEVQRQLVRYLPLMLMGLLGGGLLGSVILERWRR